MRGDSEVAVFKIGEMQNQGNARTPDDREMWIHTASEIATRSIPVVVVIQRSRAPKSPYHHAWYETLSRSVVPAQRLLWAFEGIGALALGKWACHAEDVFRILPDFAKPKRRVLLEGWRA